MTYEEFKRLFKVSKENIYREILLDNRHSIRIKKENTVIKNLEKIFEAMLEISSRKGFQAMSMRDLSRSSGLSMGALYSYFSGKAALMDMLRHQLENTIKRIFQERLNPEMDPLVKLRTAIETHLYLSEAMRLWFYFSYMESKNMNRGEREKAMAAELGTEKIFIDILNEGRKKGAFRRQDPYLTAAAIKAVLQDWYLKRWKYSGRSISVDQYAKFLIELIEAFVLPAPLES
ncbi:TetR/AcrR family transcriptional regulator [Thermodesulfobacteriota bacterium]